MCLRRSIATCRVSLLDPRHYLLADTQTYTGFLLPNGTVNASQPNYNYTSPLFNHVTVGGLVPGTTVRLVDPAASVVY